MSDPFFFNNEVYLITLADGLDQAVRTNGIIQMSDELARDISKRLRAIVESMEMQEHLRLDNLNER